MIYGVTLKKIVSHDDNRGFFREVIRSTDEIFSLSSTQTDSLLEKDSAKSSVNSASFGQSFGQWSHSKMQKNTVKAWHFHHLQTDWWYAGLGVLEVVLFDNREESPSFREKFSLYLGDPEALYPSSQQATPDDQSASTVSSGVVPKIFNAVLKIPPGVLHGCKVLTEYAHLFYITSNVYNPEDEGRFPYDSKKFYHNWGQDSGANLIVAERDTKLFIPPYERSKIVC